MEKREWGIGILRGNLLWLVICRIIWMFTTSIPRPYLSLYITELGGSPADVGIVNSVSAIAGLFLYPLGGYIADSRGRVRLVGIATFLYAFSFIPFAYAPNWQTLAAASFLQNLVLFYAPILTVIQADSMPAGMRGTGFAITISIPAALGVLSPFIGGYLVDYMGILPAMRLTYTVGFGAGILVAFIRMFKLKETLDVQTEIVSFGNIPKLLKESYRSFIDTLRWMPATIRVLAILQVLQIFFNNIAGPYWILYASDVIGITATSWGLLSLIQGGVRILFTIPAGRLMDSHGRRKLLIPMMVLTPIVPLLFISSKNFTNLVMLVALMAFMNSFLMPGFQSLLADYTPRDHRGRVTSAIGGGRFFMDIRGTGLGGGMLLFIPSSVALSLGGVIYEIGPTIPFMIMSAGMAIVTFWAFLRVRDPDTLYR
jgi:MFS family permease